MKNMFSRKQLGIPYGLFLVLFVAAPLLVLVYYAFTDGSGKFSITNLLNFFTDPNSDNAGVHFNCISGCLYTCT